MADCGIEGGGGKTREVGKTLIGRRFGEGISGGGRRDGEAKDVGATIGGPEEEGGGLTVGGGKAESAGRLLFGTGGGGFAGGGRDHEG